MAYFHEAAAPRGTESGSAPPALGCRLPRYPDLRGDPARLLGLLEVLLVGAGSVGGTTALHLASLGVGALYLADRGRFKRESLATHIIEPCEVGLPKASTTAQRCKAISPRTRVYAYDGDIADVPATAMPGDLTLLATDNLNVELEMGRRCSSLSRPLLQAAVYGPAKLVQIRSFRNDAEAEGAGPCPGCNFSSLEWSMVDRGVVLGCQGGSPTAAMPPPPTMSTRALCATAGSMLAIRVENLALGLGGRLADEEHTWCGDSLAAVTTPLRRNPRCRCEHAAWATCSAPRPLASCTPAELVAAATPILDEREDRLSLLVDGAAWVELGVCRCNQRRTVQRFYPDKGPANSCDRCSSEVRPLPHAARTAVHVSRLDQVRDLTLTALGVPAPSGVLVQGAHRTVLLRSPHQPDSKEVPA